MDRKCSNFFFIPLILVLLLSLSFPSEALKDKRSKDGRFIDHGDGTITDTRTNLMWTKEDSWNDTGGCMDWSNSKRWVSRITTGGYSDWRMPTVEELKKIYEKSKKNISGFKGWTVNLDPTFSKGGAVWYWSSETAGSCCARNVNFLNGIAIKIGLGLCGSMGVRAVRR